MTGAVINQIIGRERTALSSTGYVDGDGMMNSVMEHKAMCAIDGQWGPWRKWGNCSSTCGTGVQNRTRMCDSPAPSMGGRDCIGHRSQTQNCSNIPCAVDGQWGDWTNWSTCSKTCGGGQHFRSRSCDNPTPAHGGVNCTGVLSIMEDCSTYLCPVNGHWGSWGKWSTCSTSCGGGHRTRTRTCGNPFPAHGGSDCKGNSSESTTCQTNLCPVNGHWSNWGSWAKCSVTCGGGHRYQYRSCTYPAPAHGGSTCSGSRYRSSSCATTHCPRKDKYSFCKFI
ncbi:hypothetical protein FSP39_022254 [Pinctada imbricata]|uniref:Hemicentin-1 n=1 Tax=Pinctada imbricata TaxID=66713 RepID=A0AA88YH03_PINIB|nr:hypothetical protein FSP39_022254 [Pinctada imbricata]